MRIFKIILWVLLGLVLVAVAAVTALIFVDPTAYRNQIETRASAAFGREFEKVRPQGVDIEVDYQLNVEDAMTISEYDSVVFVDACLNGQDPFVFSRVKPVSAVSYTSCICSRTRSLPAITAAMLTVIPKTNRRKTASIMNS